MKTVRLYGPDEKLIVRVWELGGFLGCTVRLLNFQNPDPSKVYHDHPWPFLSLILKGHYFEEARDATWQDRPVRIRKWFNFRPDPTKAHRIAGVSTGGAWTLQFHGKPVRSSFLYRGKKLLGKLVTAAEKVGMRFEME